MSEEQQDTKKTPEHPKGALVATLLYLATIIVLWSWVYMTLIERGVNQ